MKRDPPFRFATDAPRYGTRTRRINGHVFHEFGPMETRSDRIGDALVLVVTLVLLVAIAIGWVQ